MKLADAIELPPENPDKSDEVRRAYDWYALLPQVLLRVTNQNRKRQSDLIVARCHQFINGHYGVLLNNWEADIKKAQTKKRKKQESKYQKRLQTAVKLVRKPATLYTASSRPSIGTWAGLM